MGHSWKIISRDKWNPNKDLLECKKCGASANRSQVKRGMGPCFSTIVSDSERTDFVCGKCGEGWNLLSHPDQDIDLCPGCGNKVSRGKHKKRLK